MKGLSGRNFVFEFLNFLKELSILTYSDDATGTDGDVAGARCSNWMINGTKTCAGDPSRVCNMSIMT